MSNCPTKTINHHPTIAELRPLISRKPTYGKDRPYKSAMWYIRPCQIYVTWLLVRLRMNSLQVTTLWLFVALAGYGVMCIGTPWAFMLGSMLIFFKIVLDGCDGEVARYHKDYLSVEQDMAAWVNGIYIDKAYHSIERPLWGIAVGVGLYHQTSNPWMLAAGVAVAVFATFKRFHGIVVSELTEKFRGKVEGVFDSDGFEQIARGRNKATGFMGSLFDTIDVRLRNGKSFNLTILILSLIDGGIVASGHTPRVLMVYFSAAAILSPVLIIRTVWQTVRSNEIISRVHAASSQ